MSDTVVQYQLSAPKGEFTQVAVPRPVPGPNEVSVRTKAIALNPFDWKQLATGVVVSSWPAVIGNDAAGVIESVGDEVKDFQPGDEVLLVCGRTNRSAAFQEVITVSTRAVAKKPSYLTFAEAASLSACYVTSTAAIVLGLNVALPHLSSQASSPLKSVLVLGGSSVVGAGAIQLLRQALPDATILATSSAQHHDHLLSLGATKCFERSVQDTPSEILAATPDGAGLDAILDAVGAAAVQPAIFAALAPGGPKLYSQVATGATVPIPEGVAARLVYGPEMVARPEGGRLIPSLGELLEAGKYRLPARVEVIGKGLDAIEPGIHRLQQGVSGSKLVVSLE
ncbi:chaperonin 10-like protein [Aspergillus pseudoustus]|uniref:Chaperonin 10-like protein n=1 Tax=Aspergillus pseudoustus TaxID=1810923 RepID=A0ABR4JVH1_9EURO